MENNQNAPAPNSSEEPEADPEHEHEPGPPRKRGRGNRKQVVVSCQECRRMKWKCDRVFPCQNCEKRGIGFLCPGGKLDPKGKRLAVLTSETLQQRIVELENALASLYGRADSSGAPHPLLQYRTEPDNQTTEYAGAGEVPPVVHTSANPDTTADVLDRRPGELVLGDQPGSSRFLGDAGPGYLFAPEDETHDSGFGANEDEQLVTDALHDTLPFPANPRGITTIEEICARLPTYEIARQLSDVYFEIGSFQNRIVKPDVFRKDYLAHVYQTESSHFDRHDRIESQRVAVVLLVLAKGAQMDVRLAPYNGTSIECYNLGRAALALGAWNVKYPSCSLILVQAIHLISRYHGDSRSSASAVPRFWGTLGYGVRSALQLGLHLDGEAWGLAQGEVEPRRETFWEIFGEDVIQGMTQGRPKMISDHIVGAKLPSIRLDDPDDMFHHYKYQLMQLWAEVNEVQCRVASTPYSEILRIDRKMRELESAIPPSLRWTPNDQRRSPSLRNDFQRLMLVLYVCEGLFFLHRAPFAQVLRDYPHEPLLSPMKFSYIAELEVSRMLIEVLRDALSLDEEITCRFHSFPFHAFSAIVTFAAAAVRSPSSSLTSTVLLHIRDGLQVYDKVRPGFGPRQYLQVVQRLHDAAHRAAETVSSANEDHESLRILGLKTSLRRLQSPLVPTRPLRSTAGVEEEAPVSAPMPMSTTIPPAPIIDLMPALANAATDHNDNRFADLTLDANSNNHYLWPSIGHDASLDELINTISGDLDLSQFLTDFALGPSTGP